MCLVGVVDLKSWCCGLWVCQWWYRGPDLLCHGVLLLYVCCCWGGASGCCSKCWSSVRSAPLHSRISKLLGVWLLWAWLLRCLSLGGQIWLSTCSIRFLFGAEEALPRSRTGLFLFLLASNSFFLPPSQASIVNRPHDALGGDCDYDVPSCGQHDESCPDVQQSPLHWNGSASAKNTWHIFKVTV